MCVCVCLSVGSGISHSTLCAYLCCRIHGGSEFNKLCHHLYMALFGGEMKSVQAILDAQRKIQVGEPVKPVLIITYFEC